MAHYEDIEIDQGADALFQIQCLGPDGEVRDLSDFLVRGKLNRSWDADSDEGIDFLVTVDAPPTKGVVNFSLNASQTNQLTRRRYVYDIEMEHYSQDSVSTVERILEGKVLVSRSVTSRIYHND